MPAPPAPVIIAPAMAPVPVLVPAAAPTSPAFVIRVELTAIAIVTADELHTDPDRVGCCRRGRPKSACGQESRLGPFHALTGGEGLLATSRRLVSSPAAPGLRAFAVPFGCMAASPQYPVPLRAAGQTSTAQSVRSATSRPVAERRGNARDQACSGGVFQGAGPIHPLALTFTPRA
jgi:hypothetical protein